MTTTNETTAQPQPEPTAATPPVSTIAEPSPAPTPDDEQRIDYDLMRDRAIVALLMNTSIGKAAESIGVSAKTLALWFRKDDFITAFENARRRALNQALGNLSHCCAAAVGVLHSIANDPKHPGGPRVSAALAILKVSQTAELSDISERLRRVERQLPTTATANIDNLTDEELGQLEAINRKMRGES